MGYVINEQLLLLTGSIVLTIMIAGWFIARRLAQLPDERAHMLTEIAGLKAELAALKDKLATEVARLGGTIDFLLTQNQSQAATISRMTDENETLRRDYARLRNDLADANALLRNLQPRM